MQSIRWKLVLTYFIIIVLTLVTVGIYIINSIQQHMLSQKEMSTLAQANVLSGYISRYQELSDDSVRMIMEQQQLANNSRMLMLNCEACVTFDSNNGVMQDKYMPTDVILDAIGGKNSVRQITGQDGGLIIRAAVPILKDKAVAGVVYYQVAADDVTDFMNNIYATLIMIIVIISIIIGIVSFIMSGIITEPIRSLTRKLSDAAGSNGDYIIEKTTGGEVGQLIDSFNKMTAQIKEQESKRQEFVSNASHELKTPLSSIKLISDSLLNAPDAPREMVDEFLTDMNVQVDRLTRIIDKLLTLTKMDNAANVSGMEFSVQDITELCSNIAKALRPLAEQKHIELCYEAPAPIYSKIERDRIWEAIYNILDNSIKYTKEDGKVTLDISKDENNVIIEISDTGIGIAPDEKYKIFDRFYRVDKARARETGGTGLGLSIALTAVELHGGNIQVESEEGVGSTFRIIIPITFK